ncbi:MAG: hypothetical protein O3B01_28265 [Planctomycetota bacterium]|nr:hypothetical protein [Planctomycetota bacterium]
MSKLVQAHVDCASASISAGKRAPEIAMLFVMMAALFLQGLDAKPTTKTITITEHLNQTYGRELMSFPFTAKKSSCVPDSVQLSGPDGPVPVQLTEVEFWSDKKKDVKSAALVFSVEGLKPLTSSNYTLSYDKTGVAPLAGDLKISSSKGSVELSTSRAGVRLLQGEEKFDEPKAAAEAPAPLLGIRFGNGAWHGGSSLSGEKKVSGWHAELIESGPVLARVRVRYDFDDGNVVTLTATLIAGDNTIRWELHSKNDQPDAGIELRLPPVPGVNQALLPHGYGQWARADRKLELKPGPDHFALLAPDSSIVAAFPDSPPNIVLKSADGGSELHLYSRDPGSWVDSVKPLTYGGYEKWHLDMIPKMWEGWKRKRVPVFYSNDGTVTLKPSLARGTRKWWTCGGSSFVGERLSQVKDMVLDWKEDTKRPSPRLFVDTQGIDAARKRAEQDAAFNKVLVSGHSGAAQAMRLLMKPGEQRTDKEVDAVVDILRTSLGLLGNYDVMRGAIGAVTLYDIVINTDLVTPADRKVFRAQMAYLGYLIDDPRCWSMKHGYVSGNPNMSCSYTLSLGVIGCALLDHPMAKVWTDHATHWMEKWLTDEVGPNGEWLPEGSHYGYVSLEPMITYAIATQRADIHDFSKDSRFKKVLLYFARYNTPRDPQRQNQRGIGAYGRGHSGDRLPVFGIAAPLFKDSDPALSRMLQWMWSENGYPYYMSDGRLGGCEPYYADSRLPMEAPRWSSEFFPNLGVLLRSGFNTPHESYINCLASTDSLRNLDIWTPGIGGITQWFARGKPLNTCFTYQIGYHERHELLKDGVRLARNWGQPADSKSPFGHYTETSFKTFAALPQVDYARATYTNIRVDDRDWFPAAMPAYPQVNPASGNGLEWTRQLMFLKDTNPEGPAYIVLRDTTSGGHPTAWQFWTLSEMLGSTEQAANPEFLKDKPGEKILPARELPLTDRYTARGSFGLDIEYFVASPAGSPRHTLRYGGTWAGNRVPEYQDMLHLQLPGDGVYHVVIYPRLNGEKPPTFSKLADGRIVKVSGTFGTDYVFLETEETKASEEGVTFEGTSGAVQLRGEQSRLSLSAAGRVDFKEFALRGASAASLNCSANELTLELPNSEGGEFTVTATGNWREKGKQKGVKIEQQKDSVRVTVPRDVTTVTLNQL